MAKMPEVEFICEGEGFHSCAGEAENDRGADYSSKGQRGLGSVTGGAKVAELCRPHGISDATLYTWRS